jgi:hypothetical protein
MAAVTATAYSCAWALSVPTPFAATIGCLDGRGILVRGSIPPKTAGRAVNEDKLKFVLERSGFGKFTVQSGKEASFFNTMLLAARKLRDV